MYNLTKMIIHRPANEVFEAVVDPAKIKQFWFSSSSERWEPAKTITLRYEEYNAQVDIQIIEIVENKKIVFQWGNSGEGNVVTISLLDSDRTSTIVEVKEEGFQEEDHALLHTMLDNKEGWVYMLTCLKGYLEQGNHTLRAGLVK